MKNLLLTFLALITISHISLGQSKETRSLDDFSFIEVSEAIELIITKGNESKAVIEADEDDLKSVITDIRSGVLKIERESNKNNQGHVIVRLTYQELEGVNVNSASSLESVGIIKQEDFEIEINSAGFAELELEVASLEVNVNSAGKLRVSGKCGSMDLDVDSAGSFDGYDLVCQEVQVEADTGGNAKVYAANKIDAEANTGGGIYYKGNPDKTYVDSSLGGRVVRK